MSGSIFLIDEQNGLRELTETRYESEDLLQGLLARYPQLLAGEQMDSEAPRRWLLISRETPLADGDEAGGRWSVDHLFLDQDAVPTIVEVKRSTDSRVRREVVGQMLDYAANAVVYWDVDRLRAHFELRCDREGLDPEEVLEEFLDEDADRDFWGEVKTNLQAGRIRLVFVADAIPKELQRVVEFLNRQMDPAEVLAVEVRRFGGEGAQSLVPRVLGQTMVAEGRRARGERPPRRQYEGTILRIAPEVLARGNPRRPMSHGWLAFEVLRRAEGGTLSYEEYRRRLFDPEPEIRDLARQIGGAPDAYQSLKHIRWDIRHGSVVAEARPDTPSAGADT